MYQYRLNNWVKFVTLSHDSYVFISIFFRFPGGLISVSEQPFSIVMYIKHGLRFESIYINNLINCIMLYMLSWHDSYSRVNFNLYLLYPWKLSRNPYSFIHKVHHNPKFVSIFVIPYPYVFVFLLFYVRIKNLIKHFDWWSYFSWIGHVKA